MTDQSTSLENGQARGSIAPAALEAYEQMAYKFRDDDPRDQYTYMYSKMRSDYTLMEHVGVHGKRILNIGCSFPVDEIYYARKVEHWISIDISQESLDVAREIVDEELHPDLARKFEFQYADATALPFEDGGFDLSVSMSTVDHLPTPEARQASIDEMARTTRSGGHVVVTVPNWWCLPYAAGIWKMRRDDALHYGYVHLFSPLEIRRMGRQAGLVPKRFASSISPPDVWLDGYPFFVRWPAKAVFAALRTAGYFGRRVGYVFEKP
ncbi:MAG: class I SAM-dependent methyltransferase [Thermoanaerobaculia bacterium]